jgi:hypothetical protein
MQSRVGPSVALVLVLMVAGPVSASAATLWVNDDAVTYSPPGTSCENAGYAVIQAAVSAAAVGDTVRVCSGVYEENVHVGTQDLRMVSTRGPDVTTIEAVVAGTPVITISAIGVLVRGFTIVPGTTGENNIGINVAIEGDTDLDIRRNVVLGGRIGINLGCASAGTHVAQNLLTGQTEAGLNIDTCEAPPFPGSHDNLVHHNVLCSTTSTGSIALGGSSDDNLIHHNTATNVYLFGSGNFLHHNTTKVPIADNGSGNVLKKNKVDSTVCP